MMKNTFEKRIVENAESAQTTLKRFLETPGTLTDIGKIPGSLVESCSDTLEELNAFLGSKTSEEPTALVETTTTLGRFDPPSRSLEGRILRDIRAGKEVSTDGDPDRRKAFTFLTKNGFIHNVGSRRYPIYEAIDAE